MPAQTERAGVGEETDVITIGIGGNSLPLGEVLLRCLALGAETPGGNPCQDYFESPPDGVESLDERLARIQDEYITMLVNVHGKAPNAKVITVGYPALLPEDTDTCGYGDPTETFTIARGDLPWLRKAEERLNQTIKTVTDFFGDRYIDTYASSEDHDVCQPDGEKWIEGLCGTVDPDSTWPAGDCAQLSPGQRQTFFHPNNAGHTNTANLVERSIRIALLEL
ncbi:GDSL-type esterase/lipase family protein [Streptomyces sp. MNU76]|uniref:GDSL-type esterase/lipase family protein n=1 Tax=Streptomyces sp. MNU76 TaxID=2560026 RepID=UPI001E646B8D|nr:GDSL-type esterase/lipase family protein [Streptomyces sp. MNU76]MCC9706033.1 GDSL-type esterase/lipase family protein [Streptomyces sp. MNU76]